MTSFASLCDRSHRGWLRVSPPIARFEPASTFLRIVRGGMGMNARTNSTRNRAFAWGVIVLLAALLAAGPLQAQMDTGSILGTVSDQSGAVLSGAKVTLTNEGTGASLSTTAGADGVFKFTPIKIGSYRI